MLTGFCVQQTPEDTIQEILQDATKIDASQLAPWQKINALNTFLIPHISIILRGSAVAKVPHNKADKLDCQLVKKWLFLPQRASNELVYIAHRHGGANVPRMGDLCDVMVFEKISKGMMERGHNRDSEQCRVKVKELRQAYRKTKEANSRSGSEPRTCCFYTELHAILGGAATTTTPLTVDSEVGVISTMPEESADGKDEEEEEEDKLAESTQHFILPNSQDLFLSLSEVPSQGSIPDNDPMEGTSGE
ncbi:uncharacterized protein LOC135974922 [Chrysemys picta bellii]|uniref:uncharacterized protein LOC135974922 n=1 Tax=Chrysemys picta bellii TaxID=8478 RepID=UPI0032B213F9